MGLRTAFGTLAAALALALPAQAGAQDHTHAKELEAQFDRRLGTAFRKPVGYQAVYKRDLARRVAEIAEGSGGRIGVAALDLATGERVTVLGDQRFPMASTSKIAIAATFMDGVEKGRWRLDDRFPMLLPVASKRFSTAVAPVAEGQRLAAIDLIEQMITRSSNPATDALLRVVGGPKAVNAWMRRAGIREFSIDRDIATLVRDDGEFNPANHIDARDSATPNAMVDLLSKLYQGKVLTSDSRDVILGSMGRTVTGKRRMRALIPAEARVLHKTGTLSGTASDIGFMEPPTGKPWAMGTYGHGQGPKPGRDPKTAARARALNDGYGAASLRDVPGRVYADASYRNGGSN